ncbi:possible acetyltransferase (GNAT family) [Aurantimonas manganoxydans SI85-9A1]|uniref:Possible acetyltransferase (GNAT family) n=2 Tax=Aurantimonas manganoxydans TaxID=651183 RepID=Q1YKJ1_AURMS|nr:possible acetyltransferase (GNAT family) [Aurantimonas manganoxydans SI85-9A1]
MGVFMSAFPHAAAFENAARLFAIGAEQPHQIDAREALLDRAMGPGRTRKSSEAIRQGRLPAEGLAFSATAGDGSLMGTVRLWNIEAGARDGSPVPALLLGPLAVDPQLAGTGIGAALMRHAIAEAARLGHDAIVLVGDPEYYARFGFCADATAALAMPGPFESRRLLALELAPDHLRGASGIIAPAGPPALTAQASSQLLLADVA